MSGPSAEVGSAYAKIGLDPKELDSGMASSKSKFSSFADSLESRAKSAGSAIAGALKTAVVAGGVAAAGAATAGLMSFKDLESAASSAASKSVDVNGKSVEQIKAQYDDLQKHVMDVSRELGAATVFDPTDVAAAYDALAGAGQNVANIGKNELLPFLNLASTDMEFGLGRTTELTMGMMNSWGMSMEDSGKIADMLTKGVNGTSASLEDYAYALKQSGSVAAGNKMPLQEYLAIIGDLKDHYIQGEMAGEALKTGMLALASATPAQTAALEALGLTFDDVNPATHDFMDIMGTLKEKGATISDFSKIFTDSSGSILYYAAQDTEKIKELTGSISDSGGLAQTMADLVMGNDKLVGSFEAAKGATSDLFIALGSYLEPAAVEVLNAWSKLTDSIKTFGDAISKGDWSKVGDMISEGIKGGWETLYPLGQQLYDKIQGVSWSGLGSYVSGGIKSTWSSLYPLGNDLLGKLKGVKWGEVGDAILSAGKRGLTLIGDYVKNWTLGGAVLSGLLGNDWSAFDRFKTTFNTMVEGLTDIGKWVWTKIDAVKWSDVTPKIEAAFNNAVTNLSGIGQKIYADLLNVSWSDVGVTIGKSINQGWSLLKDTGRTISGWISNYTWSSTGEDLGKKVKSGIDRVSGWADAIKRGISETVEWDTIGEDLGNAIKGGIKTVKDYHDAILSSIKGWITAGGAKNLGSEVGTAIANGVKSMIDVGAWFVDSLTKKGGGNTIVGAFQTGVDWMMIGTTAVADFTEGFIAGFGTLASYITAQLTNAIIESSALMYEALPYGMGTDMASELRKNKVETPEWSSTPTYTPGGGWDYSGYTGSPTSKTYDDSSVSQPSVGTSGNMVALGSGLSTKITMGYSAGGVRNELGVEDWVKYQQEKGANWDDIYQSLSDLKSETGVNALKLSDIEYLKSTYDEAAKVSEEINAADKEAATDINEERERSFGEAIDVLRDGIFESNAELRSGIGDLTSAVKENTTSQVQASAAASTSMKLGGEVTGKFLTNAGSAVSIGLDSSGKQWAVIGQVANKQWTDAGNTIIAGTTASAQQVKQLGGETGQALKLGGQQGGTSIVSSASQAATQTTTAATTGATKTTTAALTFQEKINQGASAAMTAISKAGDPASKLVIGAQSAASMIASAGSNFATTISALQPLPPGPSPGGHQELMGQALPQEPLRQAHSSP